METRKKKARETNIMNRDNTKMEDEAGKGQEGEDKGSEGKGDECLKGNDQQDGNEDIGFDIHADDDGYGESEYSIGREGENGTGKGHGGKEKVAAALAANLSGKIDNKLNVKVDKHGHPMVVGDTVMCYAAKQKDKYDRRKAKVERLNAHQAVITMLEGLAQGEKRKVDYKWLEHCSTSKKLFVSGASSCEPVEKPSAAGHAQPMEESPLAPDSMCRSLFGDLSMMD